MFPAFHEHVPVFTLMFSHVFWIQRGRGGGILLYIFFFNSNLIINLNVCLYSLDLALSNAFKGP